MLSIFSFKVCLSSYFLLLFSFRCRHKLWWISDFLSLFFCVCFWVSGFLGFIFFPWFSNFSKVSGSEVRIACPSISFLFARLGGSLGIFPYLENFVFKGNNLSVALTNLLPLIRQSIDWFESLVKEWEIMSKVRSSELETGLSSSGDPMEGDIAVSTIWEVRAFHALEEVYGLDADTLCRYRDRFQFSKWVRVRLPNKENWVYHFFPGEVCFYKPTFICGLRFPVHPFLMELLDHFGITPGQLMPNSWMIVVSCIGIWLVVTDGACLK